MRVAMSKLISGLVLLSFLLSAATALAASDPAEICVREVHRAEAREAIPDGLFQAISIVESGRWDSDRRASIAWPWTVTAEGKGQFFPSKSEAIAEVRRLKARGVRNIDVGCMQVNLHHHGAAFGSLEEAFDPQTNVTYAARFLRDLFETHASWIKAASHYHSATEELGNRYRAKVLAVWKGKDERPAQPRAVQNAGAPVKALAAMTPPTKAPAPEPAQTKNLERAKAAEDKSSQERLAARAFAESYRQAKLEEWKSRRLARSNAS
jgi:hypothetical protein